MYHTTYYTTIPSYVDRYGTSTIPYHHHSEKMPHVRVSILYHITLRIKVQHANTSLTPHFLFLAISRHYPTTIPFHILWWYHHHRNQTNYQVL